MKKQSTRRSRSNSRGKGRNNRRQRSRSKDRRERARGGDRDRDRDRDKNRGSRRSRSPRPARREKRDRSRERRSRSRERRRKDEGRARRKDKTQKKKASKQKRAIKYAEPEDKTTPEEKWAFSVYKDKKRVSDMPRVPLYPKSKYMLGRDKKVDVRLDHPSLSKEHAVVQYRLKLDEDGLEIARPYILDLNSTNGTFINKRRIDPLKYILLMEKDVVTFGASSRKYVVYKRD